MNLSDKEEKLLKQYQDLSNSNPSLVNRLIVEIIPPAIFVAIGIYSGKIHWFLLVIVLLVSYNVIRVLGQYRNIEILRSISIKILNRSESEEE